MMYAAIVGMMIFYLYHHPSFAQSTDTGAFVAYALKFRAEGFLADFGNIRPYGYPLFLSLFAVPFETDPQVLLLSAGIVQATLYGCAAWWLAALVRRDSPTLSYSILVGLLLNPYLVSIVVDGVSDSLSLSLHIGAAAVLLKSVRTPPVGSAAWLAVGAALANFSLMVRPSNFVFVVAWVLAASIACMWRRDTTRARLSLFAIHGLSWAVLAIVLWRPQYRYNLQHLGQGSIFPGCPIGELQLAYGILNLKYETLIRADSAVPLFYPNPWFVGPLPANLWSWYLEHPVAGAATIFGHLFAAFNIDHLFVYLHERSRSFALIPLLGWIVNFGGAAICANWLREGLQRFAWRADWFPVAVFVAIAIGATVAINALAAVETRVNLLPLALLSVAAAYGCFKLRAASRRTSIAAVALLILGGLSLAALYGSQRIRVLQTGELLLSDADRSRLQFLCYHEQPPA